MNEYGQISQETQELSPLLNTSNSPPYGEDSDEIEEEELKYANLTPCSEIELSDEEREDMDCDSD